MRRLLFATLLAVLSFASPARAQERHNETAGGFSYIPPAGWAIKPFPGLTYGLLLGPTENEYAANLNFVVETKKQSFDDFVTESENKMKSYMPEYVQITKAKFKTAKGVQGVRITASVLKGKRRLKEYLYFFPMPGGKKIAVTGSALPMDLAMDAVFDKTVASLQFAK